MIKRFLKSKPYDSRYDVGIYELVWLFFLDTLRLLRSKISEIKNKKYLDDTKLLRDLYKGEGAFVFANGPSLNKLDLNRVSFLQSEHGFKLICVNSFIRSFHDVVKPDFYVLSDPAYFGVADTSVTEKRLLELKEDISILEILNIPVFIPLQFAKFAKINTKVYYFNDYEFRYFNKNIVNITTPRSYLSMTAYKALAIACFMGFDKIYISGFDNDWFKTVGSNYNNDLFYENNHAARQACSGKHLVSKNESRSVGDLLHKHSFLFLDLERFPGNIYNLDESSLVDSFTKINIKDI